MTKPTVQPAASRPPRVIVYERSGRWAAALREQLPPEIALAETRSLGECSAELALSPGSVLALEVTERNLAAVVDLLGGLNRRDPLARALVHEPAVVLLDEPTTGLDVEGVGRLVEMVRGEVDAGKVVALVSHEPALFAELEPVHIVLERGKVVDAG